MRPSAPSTGGTYGSRSSSADPKAPNRRSRQLFSDLRSLTTRLIGKDRTKSRAPVKAEASGSNMTFGTHSIGPLRVGKRTLIRAGARLADQTQSGRSAKTGLAAWLSLALATKDYRRM
jgi:hypothetical protein